MLCNFVAQAASGILLLTVVLLPENDMLYVVGILFPNVLCVFGGLTLLMLSNFLGVPTFVSQSVGQMITT